MNLSAVLDDGVTATDRRRIFRGTFHSFLIQGVSIALVFASNWWLVRSTDTASYGLYVHVFNWVSILAAFVIGGRDDLVLAQLPKYIASARISGIVRLVRAANGFILFSALLVGGAFIALISMVSLRSLSEHRSLFVIAMAAVYFSACISVNQMILQALNHIRLSQLFEKIVRPLLLIVVTGLFRLFLPRLDASNLVWVATGVSAVSCSGIGWLIVRKMRRYTSPPEVEAKVETHHRKTAWFFAISLMNLLSTRVTMLIMPWFASEAAIGIFNISYRLADLLIFPFFLMHTVLPQLFARHSTTGLAYTQSLFNESNRLMMLLSVPLLLFNIFLGKFFLGWFGPQFKTGYTALLYISLAQLLFSVFGPANTVLMMQDREKYSALCLLVYVVTLSAASSWLIPQAGITGGALAVLIGSLVYNVMLAIMVWRLCGVRSPLLAFLVRPRE